MNSLIKPCSEWKESNLVIHFEIRLRSVGSWRQLFFDEQQSGRRWGREHSVKVSNVDGTSLTFPWHLIRDSSQVPDAFSCNTRVPLLLRRNSSREVCYRRATTCKEATERKWDEGETSRWRVLRALSAIQLERGDGEKSSKNLSVSWNPLLARARSR